MWVDIVEQTVTLLSHLHWVSHLARENTPRNLLLTIRQKQLQNGCCYRTPRFLWWSVRLTTLLSDLNVAFNYTSCRHHAHAATELIEKPYKLTRSIVTALLLPSHWLLAAPSLPVSDVWWKSRAGSRRIVITDWQHIICKCSVWFLPPGAPHQTQTSSSSIKEF